MLTFRPHHFLCCLGFEGKGYSDAFTRNMQEIADHLRSRGAEGEATLIQVTGSADSICTPCPSRRGTGCETDAKIQRLDHAHAEALGLQAGDILSWGEAKGRIAERMSIPLHREICAPCSWRTLGLCEAGLSRLMNSRKPPAP